MLGIYIIGFYSLFTARTGGGGWEQTMYEQIPGLSLSQRIKRRPVLPRSLGKAAGW